jgi:UDP-N-acetylglucosamine 2-epimerase (non-hydrolysing)
MKENQDLAEVTSRILTGLSEVLNEEKPDLVMVQGDTVSAMAGGLGAYYKRIPVAHVEAGLRTGNKYQPFPEEINRRFVASLADVHFAPTTAARDNLVKEGVAENHVHVTGNTVVDALQHIHSRWQEGGRQNIDGVEHLLKKVCRDLENRLVLLTCHRRESFGAELENICQAVAEIATSIPNVSFVYPVHPNPNLRQAVQRHLSGLANVHLIDPVDYESFLYLLSRCHLVLTDSGGVQEEAPSFRKPVLVMRQTTERAEGVDLGIARLVGTAKEQIVAAVSRLLEDPRAYQEMVPSVNPYGDGRAALRIVNILERAA